MRIQFTGGECMNLLSVGTDEQAHLAHEMHVGSFTLRRRMAGEVSRSAVGCSLSSLGSASGLRDVLLAMFMPDLKVDKFH
jgi:hypothetical protein